MGIVHQKDKRSGITYVYQSTAYWDSEKKQSRAKRKLIGRLDPETGEIIPTDGRNRKAKAPKTEEAVDYEKLYMQLEKRCQSQEKVIEELQRELRELKGQ